MFQKAKFLLELFKFAHGRGGVYVRAHEYVCTLVCDIHVHVPLCMHMQRSEKDVWGVSLGPKLLSPRDLRPG